MEKFELGRDGGPMKNMAEMEYLVKEMENQRGEELDNGLKRYQELRKMVLNILNLAGEDNGWTKEFIIEQDKRFALNTLKLNEVPLIY
ncbi:MAG: hypothetical protein KKF68_03215 [Nanoarchaeota archaeon]|nr:hypothetical protein [Nanoarchaeota archaeon]